MSEDQLALTPEMGAAIERRDFDVEALMAAAIDRGEEGVAMLERLVALKERQEERDAKRAYHAALSRFQRNRPPIQKNRTVVNRSGSKVYGYTDIDQIVKTIGPTLAECGLSFSHNSRLENGGVVVTCTLRHEDGHSETSEFASMPPESTPVPLTHGQKTGQAITYGRRYTLIQILGLTDCEDDNDFREEAQDTPITDAQALEMEALANDVGADLDKMLRWAGVERLSDFPTAKYAEAMRLLHRKGGQG